MEKEGKTQLTPRAREECRQIIKIYEHTNRKSTKRTNKRHG